MAKTGPKGGTGHTTTRKPVTIDLDANDVVAVNETGSAATETQVPDPEPVAMDASSGSSGPVEATPGAARFGRAEDDTTKPAEDDAAGPSARNTPPPAPPVRRGGLGTIGAGVIGGLVTLVGAGGLQWAGVLPSPSSGSTGLPPAVSAMPGEIEALRQQIAALESRPQPAAGNEDLAARLAQTEAALGARDEAVAAVTRSLGDVETRLGELQQAVANGGAGEAAGLDVINAEIARLRDAVAAVPSTSGGTPDEATINRIAAVEEGVTALSGDVTALGDRVTNELAALGGRMEAVEAGLSEASATLEQGGADASVVARAIAAAGLKSAIDRGSAFMAELEAYASVAGEDETVIALRDHAASGVPTVTQLADDFAPVANRIVAAGQGVPDDAGIGERLMASARSLVQVRPVGEAAGDTPGAIAARMETRLKAGDLSGALAQWETLPEAAKAASASFIEDVRARQTVDGLVAGALTAAMQSANPAR